MMPEFARGWERMAISFIAVICGGLSWEAFRLGYSIVSLVLALPICAYAIWFDLKEAKPKE